MNTNANVKKWGGVNSLGGMAETGNWPTPRSRDYRDSQGMEMHATNPDGSKRDRTKDHLGCAVFATPKTNGFCGGSGAKSKTDNNPYLSEDEKRSMNAGNGGQLNPDWVEYLMSWPVGWTRKESVELSWYSWESDPAEEGQVPRVIKGANNRRSRLSSIGNGQVPQTAALAWKIMVESD